MNNSKWTIPNEQSTIPSQQLRVGKFNRIRTSFEEIVVDVFRGRNVAGNGPVGVVHHHAQLGGFGARSLSLPPGKK